ncbi:MULTISPECIES: murein hydrolase activator EnvC [unclassified Granulicatella]|uniref:murein hydrolase activator EnvC family protein n=1 Tax=unclassified Granulicatella TaxID=2630493 RepID=UPI001073F2A3|nr:MULTISPECIES: peptidoglycan DD-metalloendopeptidase family protein [unclassified Granulicatella]MBF0780532.1 peptidoglycan DD-metalloendopeptidase family protein [Granulicatella sp. 19428wC4_WM01]TFU94937.1 hypothetical protein E4T68_05430 [Granulicatella sp. WM01]
MRKWIITGLGIGILCIGGLSTRAAYADEFDDKIQEQQKKLQQIERSKLNESQVLSDLITEQTSVNKQIEDTQADIDKTQNTLTQLMTEITDLEELIAKRSKTISDQARHIQLMDRADTLFEAIFTSESIVEAISRISAMSQITGNSLDILQQQKKDKDTLLLKQQEIEETSQKQQDNIAHLNQLKQNLAANVTQTQLTLVEMDLQKAQTQEEINSLQAKKEEAEQLKREAAARLAAEQARQNQLAEAKRQAEQQARAEAVARAAQQTSQSVTSHVASSASTGSFIYPIINPSITSYFGETRQIGSYSDVHSGVDFVNGDTKAPIMAAGAGTVVYSGTSSGGGLTVILKHANGLYTYYMHLSSVSVSVGQNISQGQRLGIIGSTGISTGVHLHFGVSTSLWSGYVNPLQYL